MIRKEKGGLQKVSNTKKRGNGEAQQRGPETEEWTMIKNGKCVWRLNMIKGGVMYRRTKPPHKQENRQLRWMSHSLFFFFVLCLCVTAKRHIHNPATGGSNPSKDDVP